MSFPIVSYRRAPDIRLRPVPEMEICLVFTPANPNVYTLNAACWLILELCDGRPWDEIETEYVAAFRPQRSRRQSSRDLRLAIEDLVAKKILEPVTDHEGGVSRHAQ